MCSVLQYIERTSLSAAILYSTWHIVKGGTVSQPSHLGTLESMGRLLYDDRPIILNENCTLGISAPMPFTGAAPQQQLKLKTTRRLGFKRACLLNRCSFPGERDRVGTAQDRRATDHIMTKSSILLPALFYFSDCSVAPTGPCCPHAPCPA